MTIRINIEVLPDQDHAVQVSRETSQTGEVLGYVQPGQKVEFYFWKDNQIVLREVAKQIND